MSENVLVSEPVSDLRFRMLGPLEVLDGETIVDLGTPKQRALLGLLLINANRVVTTDRILEELWGEDAEGKERTLWVYISKLRGVLEPDRGSRGEATVLVTRGHGYLLQVPEDALDASSFESEARQARNALDADPAAAASRFRSALDMWRGRPLEDAADWGFAQAEITRLDQLRTAALRDRIEADLRCGRAAELVPELTALRTDDPLNEEFVRQLMLASYHSGRPADALRAYEEYRAHVGEELGIVPSPELALVEEQVLMHELTPLRGAADDTTAVESPLPASSAERARNPFKGLRPFTEADAEDFYGRSALLAELIRRLGQGEPLLALVGPSGSGKSSVVHAGLVPTLRRGALEGSASWIVARMVPGQYPLIEFENALLRAAPEPPDSLTDQLREPKVGMLQAATRILPEHDSHLLLVIDQFEELFTAGADEAIVDRFLDGLVTIARDTQRRVSLVVALRADFYDRPLAHPDFARLMGQAVVNVVALAPDELEEAAQRPLRELGVGIDPALLATLLGDVLGRPGSLPLFQYALTELFRTRTSDTLTLESYRLMGGVREVVSQRADALYESMTPAEQGVAEQLLLRLVTIEEDTWTRRRVDAAELLALDLDAVVLHDVLQRLAGERLVTMDRSRRGSGTVEVAHEALLTEWSRLRSWIEESRDDLRQLDVLDVAAREWAESGEDPDYLASGARLATFETLASQPRMSLQLQQRRYLDAATSLRDEALATRQATEVAARTMRRRRLLATVAGAGLLVLAAASAAWFAFGGEDAAVRTLSVAEVEIAHDASEALGATNFGSVGDGVDLAVEHRVLSQDGQEAPLIAGGSPDHRRLAAFYRDVAASGPDALIMAPFESPTPSFGLIVADHPEIAFITVDGWALDGALAIRIADNEVGFLAGALAGLSTRTNAVAYLGSAENHWSEGERAGFEAGALATNPDVEILATYGWRDEARALMEAGADVVYAPGTDEIPHYLDIAAALTTATGQQRWIISSRDDRLATDRLSRGSGTAVGHLLGETIRHRTTVLTAALADVASGGFTPGAELAALDDGAATVVTSTRVSSDAKRAIADLVEEVTAGRRTVPFIPSGGLLQVETAQDLAPLAVVWDGQSCELDRSSIEPGDDEFELRFVNRSDTTRAFWVSTEWGDFSSKQVAPMSEHITRTSQSGATLLFTSAPFEGLYMDTETLARTDRANCGRLRPS
ncbi:MAG: BTAD domain-containing putative transcriptional regulator [Actinomycetota bacterium]